MGKQHLSKARARANPRLGCQREVRALDQRLTLLETRLKIERELQIARLVNDNFSRQMKEAEDACRQITLESTRDVAAELARAAMSAVNVSAHTAAPSARRLLLAKIATSVPYWVMILGIAFAAGGATALLLQARGH